jgi:hypothetical protein
MAKSNADSKLRNIDAIKQMLNGNHKFQTKTTLGYTGKTTDKREVGDIWVDEDGFEWEQKAGYRIKKGKLDGLREELKSFKHCRKETCTCIEPSRADEKMRTLHGMCLDCVIDMEHNLKLDGKYEAYEFDKMKQNALSWLRESEKEVEALKIAIFQAPEFVTVDGHINKWELQYDPEKMKNSIEDQFNQLKHKIFEEYKVTVEEYEQFKTI